MSSGSYAIGISVNYDIGDESNSNQAGAVVEVAGSNFLVVSSYTSNLLIDNYTTFRMNITNQGDDVLNDILLDLVLPDGFIPSAGTQFYINSLNPGQTRVITSEIFVDKGVEPDSFQLPLIKTADDYDDTDTLNIIVTGMPKLSFSGINLDPEIPIAGEMQTISVQFENIGSGKAYNVVADLLLDQSVTGITTEYLGTLDREDLTSAIFDIYTPSTSKLSGEVRVSYADSNGDITHVYQSLEFDVVRINGFSLANFLVWMVIIGVVGYYAYTRYIKKKK